MNLDLLLLPVALTLLVFGGLMTLAAWVRQSLLEEYMQAKTVRPSELVKCLQDRLQRLEDWDGVAEAERATAAVEQLEHMIACLNTAWDNFDSNSPHGRG